LESGKHLSPGRDNLDRAIKVRLKAGELARLQALCEEQKITLSAGVRRLVRAAACFSPSLDGALRDDVLALVEQWRAIGVNLNQVAKAIHTRQILSVGEAEAEIKECLALLQRQQALFVRLCAPRFDRARRALEEPGSS
jgi:hypothetical protein